MARVVVVVLAILGLVACAGEEESYDGPGRDHVLVGRAANEIRSCGVQECVSLDGERQVVQVVWDDGPALADAACLPNRLHVAIADGTVIAAYDSGC